MERYTLATSERGSAMVIALLTLVLLTMVGTLFLAQTKTETQIAGHDQRATQALFHAEAGYGEILARMADPADSLNYLGEPAGTLTPGWGVYMTTAAGNSANDPDYAATETDSLDNDGDGLIDEAGERYPEILSKQTAINYPWAKVHYLLSATNQVVLFGGSPPQYNLVSGTPVIVATALGGMGTAARTVQVEAVTRQFPFPRAAMYVTTDNLWFSGTDLLYSGVDHDPASGLPIPGNPEVPGIITEGDPAVIDGNLSGVQRDNVEGIGPEPSISPATNPIDLWAWHDLFRDMADMTLPQANYSGITWGTWDDPKVVYIEGTGGKSTLKGQGAGILCIQGRFDTTSTFTWHGIVLVMEQIKWAGGSDITVYGSFLCNEPPLKMNGRSRIFYSSAAIANLSKLIGGNGYQVANWQELN